MIAQDALFDRAQALDGARRALVAQIGLELDADAAQRLKRVAEDMEYFSHKL